MTSPENNAKIPWVRRVILALVRLLCRAFFRRVEVVGLDNVPTDRGGVMVAWHPNGMVDPGLILATFPGDVVFGARHSAFRLPVLGWLMRAIGTVPIFRAGDTRQMSVEARREANLTSLDALAGRVAAGSFSCLFPEGESHDEPHPLDLKTGAARFYYRARQLSKPGGEPPVIQPVGLHYDAKREFRSSVLVVFHPPMVIPAELDERPGEDESSETGRERCRALTEVIDTQLDEVVLATESWETHRLLHRTRKLVRAERACRAGANPGRADMRERTLAFARVWKGYYRRLMSHPKRVAALRSRVDEYDADLRALGIEDHELDRSPKLASRFLAVALAAQVIGVYGLLPPLMVIGYMVNLPVAIGLWVLSKLVSQKRKDEATIKMLFGAAAFPISWLAAGLLTAWSHHQLHMVFPSLPDAPLLAGLFVVGLGAVGGVVALRYQRLALETARALRVRLTRARRRATLARLLEERARLCDQVLSMAEGLDLPGRITADGRADADGWLDSGSTSGA